jgi:uncharacterized membrane protein
MQHHAEKEMLNSVQPTSTDPFNRDNSHWVAGIFYVNPENPRLLVPKRLGGWTFNYAHLLAWLLTAGLFAFIGLAVAIALILPHLMR